jgi:predicted nucleic acid-binding protein
MSIPERVVFDAEPLVAHADGEPGSDAVNRYLDAVLDGTADGYVCQVNLTETRYILARLHGRDIADEYLQWIVDIDVQPVGVADAWKRASEHVIETDPPLGDAFALAAAGTLDATLLAGADDDYDGANGVRIERFRDEPA